MAKHKFKDFVPRPKPKKRPGRHSKSPNKKFSKKKLHKKWILDIFIFIIKTSFFCEIHIN